MDITNTERAKYEKIWSFSAYRDVSPGEAFFPHFLETFHLLIEDGDTCIDFGCGTGRVAKEFIKRGVHAILVDFASNCLDEEILLWLQMFSDKMQFCKACLWELPSSLKQAEWIYCCDVLEHIPEDKIDKVLQGMASRMKKGGYLSICLKEDLSGVNVGEKLHLTVKDKNWWKEKLSKYWDIAREFPILEGTYYNCAVIKKGS